MAVPILLAASVGSELRSREPCDLPRLRTRALRSNRRAMPGASNRDSHNRNAAAEEHGMKPEDKADAAPTDDPFPLVAYETLVAHRALCGLVVHYLESPAQLLEGE